jgi:hypothetical protein
MMMEHVDLAARRRAWTERQATCTDMTAAERRAWLQEDAALDLLEYLEARQEAAPRQAETPKTKTMTPAENQAEAIRGLREYLERLRPTSG